jgi:hypothetical protein
MTLRYRSIVRAGLACPLALLVAGCSMLGLGSPTATLTPFPSPSPLPTDAPVPATPDYLYQDSFTDPASGWPTVSTEFTAGYHPPDAYHLEVKAAASPFWISRAQNFGDFSAELQVYTENASDTGEWRHGLLFRATADDRFYAFLINPRAQAWAVLKRTAPATAAAGHLSRPRLQGSEWQVLAVGTDSSIASEPKAINTLRVDAQGPNMSFAINNLGVVALSDPEFASGNFGFVLETHDATLAHIHFDLLTVRAYDPAKVLPAPTLAPTATPSGTPTETPSPTQAAAQPTADLQATALAGTAAALGTQVLQGTIPAIPSLIPQVPTVPQLPFVPTIPVIPVPVNRPVEGTPAPLLAQ